MNPSEARNELMQMKVPLRQKVLKAAFDRVASGIIILALSPVMALIAVAIIAERIFCTHHTEGLIYRERRVSLGKEFNILKFHTIRKDVLGEAKRKGQEKVKHLERDRENATAVGRLLLRAYLDELPQLFNVLKGDMSLVGPRPLAKIDYDAVMEKGETCKALLKPGLTGIVQVNKGTTKASLLSDYEYIYNYMKKGELGVLAMDLSILYKTISKILKAEGY
ncbi:MAG: hypothetical protein DRO99_01520 [Candidatus Aenigmatarchaeota archaeon]|nr:MAG: hypothetical protein DRO99_01520 [Candidatus Aenigmarchaeota archaeon]